MSFHPKDTWIRRRIIVSAQQKICKCQSWFLQVSSALSKWLTCLTLGLPYNWVQEELERKMACWLSDWHANLKSWIWISCTHIKCLVSQQTAITLKLQRQRKFNFQSFVDLQYNRSTCLMSFPVFKRLGEKQQKSPHTTVDHSMYKHTKQNVHVYTHRDTHTYVYIHKRHRHYRETENRLRNNLT